MIPLKRTSLDSPLVQSSKPLCEASRVREEELQLAQAVFSIDCNSQSWLMPQNKGKPPLFGPSMISAFSYRKTQGQKIMHYVLGILASIISAFLPDFVSYLSPFTHSAPSLFSEQATLYPI